MSMLARIRANGGDVVRDEWRITLKKGRLTASALEWIAKHKAALQAEVWPLFWAFEERAAIMEYEAGLSRAEAERAAYAEVMAAC